MAVGRVVGRVGAGGWRELGCASERVLLLRHGRRPDTAAPLATTVYCKFTVSCLSVLSVVCKSLCTCSHLGLYYNC